MIAPVSRPAVFSALAKGPRFRTSLLWVSYVDSSVTDSQELGVGFAISRKFGNAVERNRARRRLRSAFRAAIESGAPGTGAVLVRCNRSVLSAPHTEIVEAVSYCLRAAHGAPKQMTSNSPRSPRGH